MDFLPATMAEAIETARYYDAATWKRRRAIRQRVDREMLAVWGALHGVSVDLEALRQRAPFYSVNTLDALARRQQVVFDTLYRILDALDPRSDW